MNFRKLPEDRPIGRKTQCAALISDRNSRVGRDIHGRDYRCERFVSYEIDGKLYCGQHAASLALRYLCDPIHSK